MLDAARAAGRPDRQLDVARLPDHLDRLYRAAYALCGTREDADDLVQETFERVLRRPRFLHRDDDVGYLLRVLRNAFAAPQAGHSRRPPATPTEDVDWIVDAQADPAGAVSEARDAYAAIATLSEPLRVTIVAVDVVGLSYKETARALRIRQGTVMSRLHRARERVMELLDAE